MGFPDRPNPTRCPMGSVASFRQRSPGRALSLTVSALLALAIGMAGCRSLPTRDDLLAQFHIPRSTFAAEDTAVADTLWTRLSPGVSSARVIHVLDSLGYVRSDRYLRRPHYYVDSLPSRSAIRAQLPYHESPFKMTHYVCDRPALRLTFRFDAEWRLSDIAASSLRGCI